MERNLTAGVVILIWSAIVLCNNPSAWGDTPATAIPGNAGADADSGAQAKLQQFMQSDSVFIENVGQWTDTSIKFALDSHGANVGLTDRGPRFQLFRKQGTVPSERPLGSETGLSPVSESPGHASGSETGLSPVSESPGHASGSETGLSPVSDTSGGLASPGMHEFALVFDGASTAAPTGRGRSDRTFNYLLGDAASHRQGVGSFDAVWYENLYPGVSLELIGRRTGLKYNFHVAPGADSNAIRLHYENIEGLRLTDDSMLEIRVKEDWEPLTDGAPQIYQQINGVNVPVTGRFILLDEQTYGFEITGAYDATLPLVIDPEVAWGTYLGGTDDEVANGIAVDAGGNCYVTGTTNSTGWVSGGWDTSHAGGTIYSDGYVVKLDSAGAHLWSTYLGGYYDESGKSIAVDSSGSCYITGFTSSTGWVSGGWDTAYAGSGNPDGYVVKLSDAGAHLWSTYLGDTGAETGNGIALDAAGNCYATGSTYSSGWVSGGWDAVHGGTTSADGYVVKMDGAGVHLWSSYLGEVAEDTGASVTADASGNCYVTGKTASAAWVSGGWDTSFGGTADGYVVKLSSLGAHVWSSYLGGTGDDSGWDIAVDTGGNCFAAGATASTGWVSGGGNTTSGGGYTVKLSPAGGHLWSTFLGNAGESVAVDSGGNCFAAGGTSTGGWVSGGWDTVLNDGVSLSRDGYLVKLSAAGIYLWSSYLGGDNDDGVRDIAVDASGAGYVAGETSSPGWLSGGGNPALTGPRDGFLMKILDPGVTGSLQVTIMPPAAVASGAQWRRVNTVTWRNSGDTETGVEAGLWAVEFKPTYVWRAPAVQWVAVPPSDTALVTVEYSRFSAFMSWSTYAGGTNIDYGWDIAVDSVGNCYATGSTYSAGWVSGGADTSHNGNYDGYVVKLSDSGAHLWSTYLGGAFADNGYAVAVDSAGACYAAGSTASPGWVSGGWDTAYSALGDGFAVKLSSAGALLWSTYLGATVRDQANGIAVDATGNCIVTGYTFSSGWVSGGWDVTYGGTNSDGFAVKLNATGGHVWSSYLGGASADNGNGVAVDSAGNYLISGDTATAGWVSGGGDTGYNGNTDGFVVKMSSAGGHLWSTYVGGTAAENQYGIAAATGNDCFVTGSTRSAGWVSGGWDTAFGGGVDNDGYVVKLSSAGVHLWSSYLGGAGEDDGRDVAADSSGNCYITGMSKSPGWVSGGGDTVLNDGISVDHDAYVVSLSGTGGHRWSTFLGGTNQDQGRGIAMASSGTSAWVTGSTVSPNWMVNGWHTAYGGLSDAFVVKVMDDPTPLPPTDPGATAIGTDTITWTWKDNSTDETGFKVYDDPGAAPPATLQVTTLADATSWQHDGLSANSLYAFQACAVNLYGDSAKTDVFTAYTAIEPVAGIVFSDASQTSISVAALNVPSNLAEGDSGLQFANTTTSQISFWLQDMTPWVSDGLTPNTLYDFSGQSRNIQGIATAPFQDSSFTLAADPSEGNNISADKTPGVTYPAGASFGFVNPAGFGTGTHGGSMFMVSAYRYAWDTEALYTFTGAEPAWSSDALTEAPVVSGSYYLHLQSLNEDGVAGGTLDFGPFILDADAPAAPVVSGPSLTNNPVPTWTWISGGGGNGTYRYDLDASGVWVETTDIAFTPAAGLGDGPHILQVQERDDAGNWSADGWFEVVVDTTPPAAPVVSGPALTNNPQPTWTWTSGGGGNGTYRYDLDASGVWVETTDVTFTPAAGLLDGPHILQVQERDDAGNWSADGSFEVVVDTAPPAAPVVSGPALTNNPQPMWTWTSGGDGNGTYRYDLDASGVWVETTDTAFIPVAVLGDGTHTLRVQERDDAGNWSADGSFDVVVDTAAPAAPIVTGPALTNDPTPTWTWTSGGGGNGTYRYDLDASGVWTETTFTVFTPVIGLVDGTHILRVQERDDAGNWSADGSFEITVDATPPAAPVVTGPALTNDSTPTWTWTPGGGGNGTYRYDLDASGVWTETTGTAFTPVAVLGDGTHTLRVQERDDAGNWSADGSFDIVVDTAAPAAPIVTGPALTNDPTPTWTWTSGGGGSGTYRYDLDASGVWIETTAVAFTPTTDLGDGTHTLRVQERDALGYWSSDGSHTLEINTGELTATLSLLGPVETGADSVAFAVTFNRAVTPSFVAATVSVTGSLAGSVLIGGIDPDYVVTVTLADPNADGTVGIAVAGGVVQDAYGNVYAGGVSPEYRIYNWLEPWFTESPVGARKYTGDDHAFSARANCQAPSLTYQWKWRDAGNIVRLGPASPSWSLTDLALTQAGTYWCEATYGGVTRATAMAVLQVADPLRIEQQPEGGTRLGREDHTFTVVVSGGYDPLNYQWRKDGALVPDAPDASTWTLTDLAQTDDGTYTVVITDDNGMSVASMPAVLVVNAGLSAPTGTMLTLLALIVAALGAFLLRWTARRERVF